MSLKRTIVAALAACILAGSAHAETRLSLSYFMGPKHRFNEAFFTPFAEKLAKLSGGKLTVKQYPGGTLNSNPALQYSTVVDGVTDVAFVPVATTAPVDPIAAGKGEIWTLGKDEKPVARKVTLGVTDGKRTQVTSGNVKAGEEFILDVAQPGRGGQK